MKKGAYLAIIICLILSSCSLDDSANAEFSFEFMPVESVVMPEEFMHGETYAIGVSYTKPNSCYQFNDFAYEINGNERTIAVINTVYSNSNANCTGEPVLNTVSFDFTVTGTETYVFKFYQGEDEAGEEHYYIVEVPVVDGRMNPTGTKTN
jgi:hypothetical protein